MDIDGDIPQKIEAIGKPTTRSVAQQKAVLEDSPENHRTRRRAPHNATALQYITKLLFGFRTHVALRDGFRQPAIEPDATRAFDWIDEGIRVGDVSLQSMKDKNVLRADCLPLRCGRYRGGSHSELTVLTGGRHIDD